MPSADKIPELYHYEREDAYECLGCGELMETPYRAVLQQGQQSEQIKSNPENRLLWVELMTEGHKRCGAFKDEAKQKHAMFNRKAFQDKKVANPPRLVIVGRA